MCEACAVKIILAGKKNLRLCLQSAKRSSVDDPIAVLLERRAVVVPTFVLKLTRSVEGVVKSIVHKDLGYLGLTLIFCNIMLTNVSIYIQMPKQVSPEMLLFRIRREEFL